MAPSHAAVEAASASTDYEVLLSALKERSSMSWSKLIHEPSCVASGEEATAEC